MEINAQIHINASPDHVFSYFVDDAHRQQWLTGLMETVFIDKVQTPNWTGYRFLQFFKSGGQAKLEYEGVVMSFDYGKSFVTKLSNQQMVLNCHYRFIPTEHGTELRYLVEAFCLTPATWINAIPLRIFGRRRIYRQLGRLKRVSEQSYSARSAAA